MKHFLIAKCLSLTRKLSDLLSIYSMHVQMYTYRAYTIVVATTFSCTLGVPSSSKGGSLLELMRGV